MFRTMIAALAALFALTTAAGCVVVDNSPTPHSEAAPYLAQPYVGCDWDPTYGDYFWYFEVQASDSDYDLATVGVDVYNRAGQYLESWQLNSKGGSTFALTVYEYYSDYLSCPYGGEFQLVFYAQDYAGHETQLSASSYVSSSPVVTAPYVECGYDPAYAQSYWYFSADVYDPQGLGDIRDAEVRIFWAGGAAPIESFDIFYDATYGWYTTVYEQYSAVLDCRTPGNYGFQFVAEDYEGNIGYANATTVYLN